MSEQQGWDREDGYWRLWLPSWSLTFTLATDFSTRTLRILRRCLVAS